jgi:hypothetical protein
MKYTKRRLNDSTAHGWPCHARARGRATGACSSRVRPPRRLRDRPTEYGSKAGAEWLSGGAKRQCGRALRLASCSAAPSRARASPSWRSSSAACDFERGRCQHRLGQNMQVGPCIPAGIQLQKVGAGPTSGPTRHLAHFVAARGLDDLRYPRREAGHADLWVISDCHFVVQRNHCIPNLLTLSVAVFLKRQSTVGCNASGPPPPSPPSGSRAARAAAPRPRPARLGVDGDGIQTPLSAFCIANH